MELAGLQITRGCWIDLYEAPRFAGKVRRIFGPALYAKIRNDHEEHPVQYQSLIAGPTAYAHLFTQRRPERGGLWLLPKQKLADINLLKSDLPLDSIRILNRIPLPSEPGYSIFSRQIGKSGPEPARRRRKRRKKK